MKKRLAYRLFVRIPFWAVVISILLVTAFRWIPVRFTPLMLKRSIQNKEVRAHQKWVSLDNVSPALIQAVIASEDNRFCEHKGFDWKEIKKMLADHKGKGKKIRGCSTISMQVAKNVFTFGSRTWVRKGLEAWWTFLIERIWGKRRIMEVYLNVAETGPGLYGVEAAAMHYYGVHAKDLDRKQACALAACLPAPLERSPIKSSGLVKKRQAQVYALIPTLRYPEWAL